MKKSSFKVPLQPAWQVALPLTPERLEPEENFALIPAEVADVQKVLLAYQHHPVDQYDIASVEIIYNPNLEGLFKCNMSMLNTRVSNAKYNPTWANACQGNELVFRQSIVADYKRLAAPYTDMSVPHVKLLPLWHGTRDNIAQYIFNGGYGIFTANDPRFVTDEGFFGKGIYSAYEAEYSFRAYAAKHGSEAVLLFNWVSFFEAYPVIYKDMAQLRGVIGGQSQCDAHFVPVRSDQHPNTDVYDACEWGEQSQYTEVVVFNEAQCLPRYRVKLQRRAIAAPFILPALQWHQVALDAWARGDYEQARPAFEQAAGQACALSFVRLHWLSTGGSEIISGALDIAPRWAEHCARVFPELKRYAAPFERNDAEAQFLVAWCYAQGLGVSKDIAEAAKYYWMAAEQNHADAAYQLAECCNSGEGVDKSMELAIAYYQKAAAGGHVHANYKLGQLYALGFGIAPNPELAAHYRKAAEERHHPLLKSKDPSCSSSSEGSNNPVAGPSIPRPLSPPLGRQYYDEGHEYEKAKAYEEAAQAYQKGANVGHTRARSSLAFFFLAGRGGCARNPEKAYALLAQSAEEGHPRAMRNLANQLRKGYGVPKDEAAAQRWEDRAKDIEESSAGIACSLTSGPRFGNA
jgi:TPR repeat protein